MKTEPQGTPETAPGVGSSDLLGGDSLVKSMRAFDRAVLSHLDDERNHTAELSERTHEKKIRAPLESTHKTLCGLCASVVKNNHRVTETTEKGQTCRTPPNDPSSATRPTRRMDCNLDAMAGFAAAHG